MSNLKPSFSSERSRTFWALLDMQKEDRQLFQSVLGWEAAEATPQPACPHPASENESMAGVAPIAKLRGDQALWQRCPVHSRQGLSKISVCPWRYRGPGTDCHRSSWEVSLASKCKGEYISGFGWIFTGDVQHAVNVIWFIHLSFQN